jgi:hypothetical protein
LAESRCQTNESTFCIDVSALQDAKRKLKNHSIASLPKSGTKISSQRF